MSIDFVKYGQSIAKDDINKFHELKKQIKENYGSQAAMEFDTGFNLEMGKVRETASYDYGPNGVDPITYGINDYDPYESGKKLM